MIPRRIIRVRLQREAPNSYQLFIDGKPKYFGLRFCKQEAMERVAALERYCDIEWEEPIDQPTKEVAAVMPKKQKEKTVKPKAAPAELFGKATQELFWASVSKGGPDECWPWTGPTVVERGKTFTVFRPPGHNARAAQKYAFSITHKALDGGRVRVIATCGNPACCNGAHLKEQASKPQPVAKKATAAKASSSKKRSPAAAKAPKKKDKTSASEV